MNSPKIKFLSALIALASLSTASAFAATASQTQITDTTEQQTQVTHVDKPYLQWGLSEKEYDRYKKLMKGIRGSISPANISPIEVLGIHARSQAERMKYARMWADMMEKDTERVLAFQAAYNEAWKEKGNPQLINTSKLLAAYDQDNHLNTNVDKSGRLILVTQINNCPKCDRQLGKILNTLAVDPKSSLDIYFTDSAGETKSLVRQWAMKNNVNADLLRSGRITLNHGEKLARQYHLSSGDFPALFKIDDNGGVTRVE